MGRTDNDTWDITEGVGATALSVARPAPLRRIHSTSPLFTDPYADYFVAAAVLPGVAAAHTAGHWPGSAPTRP